jgi:hypothetical protein
MNTYVQGAAMAFEAIAHRFVDRAAVRTPDPTVNILGLTPLDFTVNGTDASIARFLEDAGYRILSRWAMGSTLEELSLAGGAHVNLVVSTTGLRVAKVLQELFGTPYVVGVPMGEDYGALIQNALAEAVATGENRSPVSDLPEGKILIIGEAVTSLSLASGLELSTGKSTVILCPTECDPVLLRSKDLLLQSEDEIRQAMSQAQMVIADPLFAPICPDGVRFINLPAESFSGRLYREQTPNLINEFQSFINEVL